jgi:hypothetical protein
MAMTSSMQMRIGPQCRASQERGKVPSMSARDGAAQDGEQVAQALSGV